MGGAVSIADQRLLFDALHDHYTKHTDLIALKEKAQEEQEEEEEEEEVEAEEDEDDERNASENFGAADGETKEKDADLLSMTAEDRTLLQQSNHILSAWQTSMLLKKDVIFAQLTSLEWALSKAFASGRTPLIVDTSPDDKVCTFFSYQPDVVILEAKSMVMSGNASKSFTSHKHATANDTSRGFINREAIFTALEPARRSLVTAMKFGKMLVIRLGTTAPDFVHKFSDEALFGEDVGFRGTTAGSAYFPLCTFEQGGRLLHDRDHLIEVTTSQSQRHERATGTGAGRLNSSGVSERGPLPVALPDLSLSKNMCTSTSSSPSNNSGTRATGNCTSSKAKGEGAPVVGEGGKGGGKSDSDDSTILQPQRQQQTTKSPKTKYRQEIGWAERLFREEDMRPHKNVAICRNEFRVCVCTQLPLEEIDEYLFGNEDPATAVVAASNSNNDTFSSNGSNSSASCGASSSIGKTVPLGSKELEGKQQQDENPQEAAEKVLNVDTTTAATTTTTTTISQDKPDLSRTAETLWRTQEELLQQWRGHLPPRRLFKIVSVLADDDDDDEDEEEEEEEEANGAERGNPIASKASTINDNGQVQMPSVPGNVPVQQTVVQTQVQTQAQAQVQVQEPVLSPIGRRTWNLDPQQEKETQAIAGSFARLIESKSVSSIPPPHTTDPARSNHAGAGKAARGGMTAATTTATSAKRVWKPAT